MEEILLGCYLKTLNLNEEILALKVIFFLFHGIISTIRDIKILTGPLGGSELSVIFGLQVEKGQLPYKSLRKAFVCNVRILPSRAMITMSITLETL